jgi:hypothetical protein
MIYRSTNNQNESLQGTCWTDNKRVALSYGGSTLFSAELDPKSIIINCKGYDRESNETPADSIVYRESFAIDGAQVLLYDDESPLNESHQTWRILDPSILYIIEKTSI